jgi:hypothetical protein
MISQFSLLIFQCKKEKGVFESVYFFAFGLVFGFGLGLAFAFAAFAGFIGSPQQIKSHSSQPHGSSTKIIIPHSSHSYFSPFFFAKNSHLFLE